MIRLRALTPILAALAGLSSLPAAPPLTRLIPDSAAIVLTFQDVPSLLASAEQSPVFKMWSDPRIARFFAPLEEMMKGEDNRADFKTRMGYDLSELLAMIEGDAAWIVTDLDFFADPTRATPPHVNFLAEFGENAGKFAAVLEKITQRWVDDGLVKAGTEDYAGSTIRSVTPVEKTADDGQDGADDAVVAARRKRIPLFWTSAEGLIVVGTARETVTALLDAIGSGGVESPLERSPRYQQLRERTGGQQVTALLHVPAILPALRKRLPDKGEDGRVNPFGIDPDRILDVLGLDAWETLYMTYGLDSTSVVTRYGLTYTEERGLLKMFQLAEGGLPRPAWIPAKWENVATARFSLNRLFAVMEEILQNLSPALHAMMQGQLLQWGKQVNLDIKRDLLGGFGDEMVVARFLGKAEGDGAPSLLGSGQFYAFSLTNAPALSRALDALIALAGPGVEKRLERREYLGRTLVSFTPPPIPDGRPAASTQGFAYAVTDRYLLLGLGSAAPVEAALQAMANPGDSFWDKPEVRRALAEIPEDAGSIQIQNVPMLLSAMFDWLIHMAPPIPGGADNGGTRKTWVDASEKPPPEVIGEYLGHSVGYVQRDSRGVHAVVRMSFPQP